MLRTWTAVSSAHTSFPHTADPPKSRRRWIEDEATSFPPSFSLSLFPSFCRQPAWPLATQGENTIMRESVPLWSRENVIGPNNIHWWHSVNEASVGCTIHPIQNRGEKKKKKTTTLLSSSVHSIIQHGKHGKRSLTIWGNDQTHTLTDVDARSLALPSSINWQMSGQQQRKEKERKDNQRGRNTVIIWIALMHPLLMTRLSFPWRRHLIEYFAVTYGICCCCCNNNNKFKFLKLRWHTIGNHWTCIHKYRPSSDALSISLRAGSGRPFGRG